MKKLIYGFILFLVFFAESVYGATRDFQLAWTYTGTQHSGFHVEYMPPGGSFALAPNGTINDPAARTFTHANVTANVGQTLSWRVRAFNSSQTSAYSNTATAVMPTQNLPPSVNAGTDFSVAVGATANLNGTVTDDGLPSGSTVTTTWSKISGPGTVTFGNTAAIDTTASFNAVGTYTLRLSATDSQLFSSDDVVATVTGTTPLTAAAPTVTKVIRHNNRCTFTLTGTPPDGLGGWTVQFKYSQTNFGSPDSTSPYSVALTLRNGTYDFWGSWTKTGQNTVQSAHSAGVCP